MISHATRQLGEQGPQTKYEFLSPSTRGPGRGSSACLEYPLAGSLPPLPIPPLTLSPREVLGSTFLRKYYSIFDADQNRIGFLPARHAEAAGPVDPTDLLTRGAPPGPPVFLPRL